MNTLRDYVDWKLTHSDKTTEAEGYPLVLEKYKVNSQVKNFKIFGSDGGVGNWSRNLFDKDNFAVYGRYMAINERSTDTGIAFDTPATTTTSTYGQLRVLMGSANDFRGKTITFSSPDFNGTAATKIGVSMGATNVQQGSDWKKSGDVYYSTITVEDKEYTTEAVVLMLYFYGKQPNTEIVYSNIMVNEGSEPLPYEQHNKYIIPIVQESLDNEKNILTEGAFSNNVNCIYDNGTYTFTRIEAFPNRFSGIFNVNVQAGSKLYVRCDRFEETYSGILGLQITYADATNTTMIVWPYSSNAYFTVTKDVKSMRLYLNNESVVGEYVKFKNLVICVDKQPTLTKQTHNVFVDEPLSSNDILDVKEHMELPKLTAKTTVFTTDTTTPPSKMYGKYIKK